MKRWLCVRLIRDVLCHTEEEGIGRPWIASCMDGAESSGVPCFFGNVESLLEQYPVLFRVFCRVEINVVFPCEVTDLFGLRRGNCFVRVLCIGRLQWINGW